MITVNDTPRHGKAETWAWDRLHPKRIALERSAKGAIAKYAWSGRERLGLLRTGGGHLFLTRGIPCAQALRRCGHG